MGRKEWRDRPMMLQTFSVIFVNLARAKKVFSEKPFGNWDFSKF